MNSPFVLEKNVDTVVPLAFSNLENMKVKYDRLTSQGKDSSLNLNISLPKIKDSIVKTQFPVRKMLEGRSGIIQGEIVFPKIYEEYEPWYPDFFIAQVTPFHVHAKISHFNTIV
jgi:hypothetical protein